MLTIRRAEERGHADHGWLDTYHTFSFAHYYDPAQVGFSDLLVLNDDRVNAGRGFGTHPHRDMEIFTYVLEGALEHRDSMGTGSVIRPGDIQMMSAGTGVRHSEFNHSKTEPVHFLQIWIVPNRQGVEPRYHQVHVPPEEKRGRLRVIIGDAAGAAALPIYQDARVLAGLLDGDESAELTLAPGRYAYVHVAQGAIALNGLTLKAGDGVRVRDERILRLTDGRDADVLVFDLRASEVPAA